MTSPKTLLILTAVICISFTAAEVPADCCLTTTDKPFPAKYHIKSYTLQEAGKGCAISATVFISRTKKQLCTPHPDHSKWVKDYITAMQKKKARQ
ncbi:C-C motif chemokine 5-like [Polymixia lowei]